MVVEFINEELVFNWDELPEKVRNNLELRDKIFAELQEKFDVSKVHINPRSLFDMNKYVVDRVLEASRKSGIITVPLVNIVK